MFDIPPSRASRARDSPGNKINKTTKSAPNVKWGRCWERMKRKKKIVINPEIARSLHEPVRRHFYEEEKERKKKDMNKLKEFR
jgi:hypothetical protein